MIFESLIPEQMCVGTASWEITSLSDSKFAWEIETLLRHKIIFVVN